MDNKELAQIAETVSRILSRQVAVEMTAEEIDQVAGGADDWTESGGDCDKPKAN
jgi:hypothetical protein